MAYQQVRRVRGVTDGLAHRESRATRETRDKRVTAKRQSYDAQSMRLNHPEKFAALAAQYGTVAD